MYKKCEDEGRRSITVAYIGVKGREMEKNEEYRQQHCRDLLLIMRGQTYCTKRD
jgi:hypothetical protein